MSGIQVNGADDPGSVDLEIPMFDESSQLKAWEAEHNVKVVWDPVAECQVAVPRHLVTDSGVETEQEYQDRVVAMANSLGIKEVPEFSHPMGLGFFTAFLSMASQPLGLLEYEKWRQLHDDDPAFWSEVDKAARALKVRQEAKKQYIAETGGFGRFDPADVVFAESIKDEPDVEWLIEGVLECEANGMLFSDSYVGKSFLALDWATCISSGVDWHGRKTKMTKVLYLMMEGGKTTKRRLAALQEARSVDLTDQGNYFTLFNKVVNFMDDASVDSLTEYVKEQEFGLVIVDTLSRSISGANENGPDDMGAFVMAMSKVREANPTGSVLVLHHTIKGNPRASRGHGSLFAAMDTIMCLVKEDGDYRTLEWQKVKSGPLPKDHTMIFETYLDSAVLQPSAIGGGDPVLVLLQSLTSGGAVVTRPAFLTDLMNAGLPGCGTTGSAGNRVRELTKQGRIEVYDGNKLRLPPGVIFK